MPSGKNFFRFLGLAGLVMCGTLPALAEVADRDCDRPVSTDTAGMMRAEERFWQECATCHIGYPPGMLPTEAWRNIMAGLEKHFGTDASLPAREIEEITAFLAENSTDCWNIEIVPVRITATDWFRRKHNSYVIPQDIWGSRSVKSPANCSACHWGAGSGHYNARSVRLPR